MISEEKLLEIKSRLLRPDDYKLIEETIEKYGIEHLTEIHSGVINPETCEWSAIFLSSVFIGNYKRGTVKVLSVGVRC